jgi:hypothetical protein
MAKNSVKIAISKLYKLHSEYMEILNRIEESKLNPEEKNEVSKILKKTQIHNEIALDTIAQ